MNFHITVRSNNKKTGPIPVTTSDAKTCNPECGMFRSCYAKQDLRPSGLGGHWKKVTSGERSITFAELCDTIASLPAGQIWRHNQAGDLPGIGGRIDAGAFRRLIKSNVGKRGFTYTHKGRTPANIALIREANAAGFVVSLSTDSAEQAIDVKRRYPDLPVVCVVDSKTTNKCERVDGIQIVTCPAALDDSDKINCSTCQLCARPERSYIIAFPAHGRQKGSIDKALSGRVSLAIV